jgi:hypothetical protein
MDTNDSHIIETKRLRIAIDDVIQQVRAASDKNFSGNRPPDHPVRSSRERSLAVTKLQEAVMWLGMDLKEMGTPNPYPNSRDTSNATVDPTADGIKL